LSKQPSEEKRVITFDELLIRAEQLKEYLDYLANTIETYTSQAIDLQIVLATLDSLVDGDNPVLMVLDRLNTVFIPAVIPGDWASNVIVNIGRNYYVKTSRDKAKEIVSRRLSNIRLIIERLRKQYEIVLNEYTAVQQLISRIYEKYMTAQREQKTAG